MIKKVLLIAFIIIVTFSISLLAQDNDKLIEGISMYYSGSYLEAITVFEDIISGDSNNIDALYYQTLAYLEEHNLVKAKENISKMEKLGYQFGIIHWKLGSVYLNKDGYFDSAFFNEARKELEKSRELGISTPGLHSDLAMAYQGLGNLEKAAQEYEIALSKGAQVEDYINLANLYSKTGRLDSALQIYRTALESNANSVSIYLNMGNIYLEKGQYQEAIDILKKGVELSPEFIAIRTRLAVAYYQNQEYDKAAAEFTRVVEQNENIYEAYYYLARIQDDIKGNQERAIYYYEQAIKYNPSYVKAYIALGDLYLEQDNGYKAMAQYMTALENNPNYAEGHYHLALAYHQLGMNQAAIDELRKTLHLDSNFEGARELLSKLLKE